MTITLIDMTPDQRLRLAVSKGLKRVVNKTLEDGTKYAICLLKLHPTVVPGDYPALKTAVEGVTGIQEIELLVDRETRATEDMPAPLIADGTVAMEMEIRVDIDFIDTPPEE